MRQQDAYRHSTGSTGGEQRNCRELHYSFSRCIGTTIGASCYCMIGANPICRVVYVTFLIYIYCRYQRRRRVAMSSLATHSQTSSSFHFR